MYGVCISSALLDNAKLFSEGTDMPFYCLPAWVSIPVLHTAAPTPCFLKTPSILVSLLTACEFRYCPSLLPQRLIWPHCLKRLRWRNRQSLGLWEDSWSSLKWASVQHSLKSMVWSQSSAWVLVLLMYKCAFGCSISPFWALIFSYLLFCWGLEII